MNQQVIILLLFVVGMYMFVLRPQQQRQKQHREVVESLSAGKRIVTIGGMVGEVVEVRDNRVLLRVADGGTVEYLREAVSRILPDDDVDEPDQALAEAEDEGAEDSIVADDAVEGGE